MGSYLKFLMVLIAASVLVACGSSGGGDSGPGPAEKKVTVTGKALVPGGSGVQKRQLSKHTGSEGPFTDATVVAVDLSTGKEYAANALTDGTGSFTIENLSANRDYILKVQKGAKIVKKIISREAIRGDVASVGIGEVNTLTTAAVQIVEEKLKTALSVDDIDLGTLPPGVSMDQLVAKLDTIRPSEIEITVKAAIDMLDRVDAAEKTLADVDQTYPEYIPIVNVYIIIDGVIRSASVVSDGTDALEEFEASGVVGGEPLDIALYVKDSAGVYIFEQPVVIANVSQYYTSALNGAEIIPTGDVSGLLASARSFLENQDVPSALKAYEAAVTVDPTNRDANFGIAMTQWVTLLGDPDVIALIERWDEQKRKIDQIVPLNEILHGTAGIGTASTATGLGTLGTSSSMGLLSKRLPNSGTNAQTGGLLDQAQETIPAQEMKELLEKLPKNHVSMTQRANLLARSIVADAPTVSEMQGVIDTKILPVIENMLTRIRYVEGKGYTFSVTPAMTGNANMETLTLDDGEFYLFDALLSVLKGLLNVVTAYHLDVDYDIIEADPLSALNGPVDGRTSSVDPTKFFTLKTDGADKMVAALSSLREAVGKGALAYDFVFNQWGYVEDPDTIYLVPTKTVTDHGLQFHSSWNPDASFESQMDREIRQGIQAAQMVLADTVTYQQIQDPIFIDLISGTLTGGDKTLILWERPLDPWDEGFSFTINLTKFFTNPLDRTDLPTLAYGLTPDMDLSQQMNEPIHAMDPGGDGVLGTWDDQIIPSEILVTSPLPDATFNGLIPNGIFKELGVHGIIPAVASVATKDQAGRYYCFCGWEKTLASDGNSLWVIENGSFLAKVSTDGTVTEQIDFLGAYIWDMTWKGGELWGLAWDNNEYSLVQIDVATGDIVNTISLNLGPNAWPAQVTSDGTSFYIGVYEWNSTWDSEEYRILKWNPSSGESFVLLTSTKDFYSTLFFGGGVLWADGTQINPDTGDILVKYLIPDMEEGAYLNGKIYGIGNYRITSYQP